MSMSRCSRICLHHIRRVCGRLRLFSDHSSSRSFRSRRKSAIRTAITCCQCRCSLNVVRIINIYGRWVANNIWIRGRGSWDLLTVGCRSAFHIFVRMMMRLQILLNPPTLPFDHLGGSRDSLWGGDHGRRWILVRVICRGQTWTDDSSFAACRSTLQHLIWILRLIYYPRGGRRILLRLNYFTIQICLTSRCEIILATLRLDSPIFAKLKRVVSRWRNKDSRKAVGACLTPRSVTNLARCDSVEQFRISRGFSGARQRSRTPSILIGWSLLLGRLMWVCCWPRRRVHHLTITVVSCWVIHTYFCVSPFFFYVLV